MPGVVCARRGRRRAGMAAVSRPERSGSERRNRPAHLLERDRERRVEDAAARSGGSSPVVFGDRIYLTCYSGCAVPGAPGGDLNALQRHLLCFNRADGRLLWPRDVPAAQPEEPRVREHGYASSTPAVDTERVYVFFGRAGVLAFTQEGQLQWRAEVGSGTHGSGSAASPVLYGDLVVVNAAVESESLVALERVTGREVGRAGGLKERGTRPSSCR